MNHKTFENGVHPEYHKGLTQAGAIQAAPLPKKVVIPLQQHIGAPCTPDVAKGDVVEEGQVIGKPSSFISAPIHASISGKVADVSLQPHPSGDKVLSVMITGDGETKDWGEGMDEKELKALEATEIKERVRDAGIVGLGGAAFPTVVKLSPPEGVKVNTILLNGCECEPYLTADHRLMVEEPEMVVWGLRLIMKSVGASRGLIGIEDNKADAAQALRKAAVTIAPDVKVVELETKYPQGAEKMLIKAVLGRLVPVGKLPLDVGVVVQNVGTAAAIYEAVRYGKPLVERIVTVSGNGVAMPGNFRVRLGTSFSEVLALAGGVVNSKDGTSKDGNRKDETSKDETSTDGEEPEGEVGGEGGGEVEEGPLEMVILSGGPMMGVAQKNLSAPVIKGTSGVTVLAMSELKPADYDPCIRCASCVEVCPMNLMPYRLGDLGRMARPGDFKDWMGLSCIECGCCSFVCPSKRPLVEWIRVGKVTVRKDESGRAA